MDKGKLGVLFNESSGADAVEISSSIGLSFAEDKYINASLNSETGSDIGYIGRADLSGHSEHKKRIERERQKERTKERDFYIVLASIRSMMRVFDANMATWTSLLDKQNRISENILDDLQNVSNMLDDFIQDHKIVEVLLENGFDINNSAVQDILNRYQKRTGIDNQDNIENILREQIAFEQSVVIPDLLRQKRELNEIYEQSVNAYDASQEQKASIEDRWKEALDMPDGEEKERRMRDILQDAEDCQIEAIDKLEMTEKERAIIVGEMSSNNDSVYLDVDKDKVVSKNTDFMPISNFDFTL